MGARADQIVIEALKHAVYAAYEAGEITEDEYDTIRGQEPESHVFYPDPDEPYDEDSADIISHIGAEDRARKLRYWRERVDALPEHVHQ